MSLSSKTADEISELLDEYGIKHGPVVDSTRSLYEKKLKEAMSKGKTVKKSPSSDKTYYREEEDEVTYVYRTPNRGAMDYAEGGSSYTRPNWSERQLGQETSYSSYSSPDYRGKDFTEQTSHMTYSRSGPEYKGRDFADETSHSPYSRAGPEYRRREFANESSYTTYSRSGGSDYRGREYVDEPYLRERQSSYTNTSVQTPPARSGQAAPPAAPKSSRIVPLWVQFIFFLGMALFLYLVFSNMETNKSFQGLE